MALTWYPRKWVPRLWFRTLSVGSSEVDGELAGGEAGACGLCVPRWELAGACERVAGLKSILAYASGWC